MESFSSEFNATPEAASSSVIKKLIFFKRVNEIRRPRSALPDESSVVVVTSRKNIILKSRLTSKCDHTELHVGRQFFSAEKRERKKILMNG